jgi:hypothetical protein
MSSLFDLSIKTLTGGDLALSSLKGKVILFVNVASQCGYTKQYTGLEALHNQFKNSGLVVLGLYLLLLFLFLYPALSFVTLTLRTFLLLLHFVAPVTNSGRKNQAQRLRLPNFAAQSILSPSPSLKRLK